MKMIFFVLLLDFMYGCGGKRLLLESPVVSMVKKDTSRSEKLVAGKPTEVKWCKNDPPVEFQSARSDADAMIDQVILKAHQETESLYFVQAKIYREDDCLILTAKSARVRQTR
jgi:hypothetical protein